MEGFSPMSSLRQPFRNLGETVRQNESENELTEDSLHQQKPGNKPTEESLRQPSPQNQPSEESFRQPAPQNQLVKRNVETNNVQDGNRGSGFLHNFRKLLNFRRIQPTEDENPPPVLVQDPEINEGASTSQGEQTVLRKYQISQSLSNPNEIFSDPASGPSSEQVTVGKLQAEVFPSDSQSTEQTSRTRYRAFAKHWRLIVGQMVSVGVLLVFLYPALNMDDENWGIEKIAVTTTGVALALVIMSFVLWPYARRFYRKRKENAEDENAREELSKRRVEAKQQKAAKDAEFKEKASCETSGFEGTSTSESRSESTSKDVNEESFPTDSSSDSVRSIPDCSRIPTKYEPHSNQMPLIEI